MAGAFQFKEQRDNEREEGSPAHSELEQITAAARKKLGIKEQGETLPLGAQMQRTFDAATEERQSHLSLASIVSLDSARSTNDLQRLWEDNARSDTESSLNYWVDALADKMSSSQDLIRNRMSFDISEIIHERAKESARHFASKEAFLERELAVINAVVYTRGWKSANINTKGSSFELRLNWDNNRSQIDGNEMDKLSDLLTDKRNFNAIVTELIKYMSPLEDFDKVEEKAKGEKVSKSVSHGKVTGEAEEIKYQASKAFYWGLAALAGGAATAFSSGFLFAGAAVFTICAGVTSYNGLKKFIENFRWSRYLPKRT